MGNKGSGEKQRQNSGKEKKRRNIHARVKKNSYTTWG